MTIFSAAITFILVMDPLGNVPLFLSLLSHTDPAKRKYIILRETCIAFLVLVIFLFFGQYILEAMHISQPALAISGGIILFLVTIRMVFPADEEDKPRTKPVVDPFIVPLAIPLIAGPSAMTVVMLFANQAPFDLTRLLAALVIACAVTAIILIFADNLRNVLGQRGLIAMERLMGMILTTMAVQMTLTGLEQFIHL